MRHVLQLELHQEIELAELLRHDDAKMMLLKGHRLVRTIDGEPEIVVTVQIHPAVDDLAQRVDGVFLRLDLVLKILHGDRGRRRRLLRFERLHALQQLLDDRLLLGQLRAQRGNIALLCPDGTGRRRRAESPPTGNMRFISAPSHNLHTVRRALPCTDTRRLLLQWVMRNCVATSGSDVS